MPLETYKVKKMYWCWLCDAISSKKTFKSPWYNTLNLLYAGIAWMSVKELMFCRGKPIFLESLWEMRLSHAHDNITFLLSFFSTSQEHTVRFRHAACICLMSAYVHSGCICTSQGLPAAFVKSIIFVLMSTGFIMWVINCWTIWTLFVGVIIYAPCQLTTMGPHFSKILW